MIRITLIHLCLMTSVSVKSQIPLDTVTLTNGVTDTFRIIKQDDDLIYYVKDGKSSQFPLGLLKEIRYGFDLSLEVDETKRNILYEKIVPANGVSKTELYLIAREWFVDAFVNSNAVIQLDDKESGTIIGKGLAKIPQNLKFTLKIYTKDGRYKFVMEDFYLSSETTTLGEIKTSMSNWLWKPNGNKRNNHQSNISNIESTCKMLLLSLIEEIEKINDQFDDNW